MPILCRANTAESASAPGWVRIPGGWFGMGSNTGQENERPRHQVWVDAFYLGECQVTNREYAIFLDQSGLPPPPLWHDPNFRHPAQPVVAVSWFDAVLYCDWLSQVTGRKCHLPAEAEWERAARGGLEDKRFPWGDDPPESRPSYRSRWESDRSPSPKARPMPLAFMTFARTCTNGAATGIRRTTTPPLRNAIRVGQKAGSGAPRAAVPGGITSRSHAARLARASCRSSATPITAFASLVLAIEIDQRREERMAKMSRRPWEICFRLGERLLGKGKILWSFSPRSCWRAPAMVKPSL